jgi:hypothetical protein
MQNQNIFGHTNEIPPPLLFRHPVGTSRAPRVRLIDLMVFAIPALDFLEIQVVGRLFISDLLLLGLFPFLLLAKGRRLAEPLPRTFLFLGAIWLTSQIATDLIRHTPFEDYTRGWAKIFFTLIDFAALYLLLYGNRKRIIMYITGLAVGGIITFYLNPSAYAIDYPWKFGVGISITWILILFATCFRPRRPLWCIGVVAFAAALNLYLGFRSFGGVCFMTAVYLFVQYLSEKSEAKRAKLSLRNVVFIGLVSVTAAFLLIKGYEYAAEQGMLGEEAQRKYKVQAAGTGGVLLGGRSEILISFRAIMDSPIIGHGSWAKDFKYADAWGEITRALGYETTRAKESGLIPTHSYLFGAWVEAGILGAVFWFWMLSIPIRVLTILYRTQELLTPLIAFIGFLLVWDILFSPYGAQARFTTTYYIIVLMCLLSPVIRRRTRKWRRSMIPVTVR